MPQPSPDLGPAAAELRVVLATLVRRLREVSGASGLTRTQASVLSRLDREGPTTASELARAEGVRPQSIGALVTTLTEAGLLERRPDPQDGRKSLLHVTDAARAQFRAGRLVKEDWLAEVMTTALSPDEREQLVAATALLRRLAQA